MNIRNTAILFVFLLMTQMIFGESPTALPTERRTDVVFALIRNARIYLNQGKVEQAKETLQRAMKLNPDDPLVQDFLRQIQQIENPAPATKEEFLSQLAAGKDALKAKKYSVARKFGQTAAALLVDPKSTSAFLQEVDMAELNSVMESEDWLNAEKLLQSVAARDPMDTHLIDYRVRIQQGMESAMKSAELEKQGILAFYRGDYSGSVSSLQTIMTRNKASARIYFYLGCSTAAMALMRPKENGSELLLGAQDYFAKVRKIESGFRYDRESISPAILKLFEQSK